MSNHTTTARSFERMTCLLVVFTGGTPIGTHFRIKLTLPGDNAGSDMSIHRDSFQVAPNRLFQMNVGDASAFGLNPASISQAIQFVVISGSSKDIGLDQDRSQRASTYELRLIR